MHQGRVLALWRHPVKSMAAEAVDAARLDALGVAGDRLHAVHPRRDGRTAERPLTARETPRMMAWSAAYPTAPGAALQPGLPSPRAAVLSPSGRRFDWDDPALPSALEADLGTPVALRRDSERFYDERATVLVTTEASRLALEAELGAPVDVRRFRTNVHLATDAGAWAEEQWPGRRLFLAGGVELELVEACRRCVIPTRDLITRRKWPDLLQQLARDHDMAFGVYGRVRRPGTTAVGDAAVVTRDAVAATSA